MSTLPLIPDTAPFTAEQRAWLNGFLAGLYSRQPAGAVGAAPAQTPALAPLTILFGSQTGTAEALAKRAAKEAGKRSFAATILDLASCDVARLAAEKNVLLITSTYGEGEPPDNAKALHTALASGPAALSQLQFSVCALGDSNYTQFCKCGADFDFFLEKHGGTRVTPRVDCDVEYEEKFSAWLNAALTALGSVPAPSTPLPSAAPAAVIPPPAVATAAEAYSRKNPYAARLLVTRSLNGEGSAKRVHHVEFDLGSSGLTYEAGDALGVLPHNCPQLVNELLGLLGCDGEEAVPAPDGTSVPLRRALTEYYDLGKPSTDFHARYAPGSGGGVAVAAAQVIDLVLARTDLKIAPVDFVKSLRRLQPRLYSISSSPKAHAGQVHLTVGVVRYEAAGRKRLGVCSTFLAERVVPSESRVGVFVHTNKAFRPPAAGDTPMIMVGPGTGIAPFRGFLHERRATGARGKNWLFFGDQRAGTDFLYREELEQLRAAGILTRLDTAFSRDQAQKIYVQHRMLEHAAELYTWLEAGAHFYVCGDASRMAKDVDAALHTAVERAGQLTSEQAAAYVQNLKATKRYARDVY